MNESYFSTLADSEILQKAASILREKVLKTEKNSLPKNLTSKDLLAGECSILDELNSFIRALLGGCYRRRRDSARLTRRAQSRSHDVIHMVSNGQTKTSKHITLGMALKSLTSSRKVVDILNRYGHCCSYNVVEELETELTFSATKQNQISPEDIILNPDLNTGVAFDDFDRYVETCSGKDTLHDTVSIIYQQVELNANVNMQEPHASAEDSETLGNLRGEKRRRTFDAIAAELESYLKKPKIKVVLRRLSDEIRISPPSNSVIY